MILDLAARPNWRDRVAGLVLALPLVTLLAAGAWLVGDLAWRGLGVIDWSYLTTAPREAGRAGGIAPILVSTLVLLVIAVAVCLPLGLAAAILLGEYARGFPRLSAMVRRVLDVLAGVPSIVYGLFGSAFFSKTLGLGFSLLAGGLTLACMVLPLFARLSEASIAGVSADQRAAAAALGCSRWTTWWRVLLPCALPGIAAALVLAVARALAETAALIFTSGYVDRMPGSLLDSGRAVSVHVLDLALNVPGAGDRAAAAALVLVGLLVVINLVLAALRRRWWRRAGGAA